MKLAGQRTIQATLSDERRVDIDNGLQLARKVDRLRLELSELEKKYTLFNEATTKELRDKTEILNQQIIAKEIFIEALERKKATLLLPVTIKWDEVNQKEQEVLSEKENLSELRTELTLYKQELDKREKALSLEEEKLSILKKEIGKQVDKVATSSLQAQNTLLDARELEKHTLSILKEKTIILGKKQIEIDLRESNVKVRESQLERDEQEIINEKIRIADQRATLDRAFARLK